MSLCPHHPQEVLPTTHVVNKRKQSHNFLRFTVTNGKATNVTRTSYSRPRQGPNADRNWLFTACARPWLRRDKLFEDVALRAAGAAPAL